MHHLKYIVEGSGTQNWECTLVSIQVKPYWYFRKKLCWTKNHTLCDCNELVRLSLRSEVDRTLQGLLGETTQACRLYWWLSSEESSPVMQELQETQVRSLGGKDLLEEGMVTHSSVLAWRPSHGQRNLAGYSPWGHKESDTPEATMRTHRRLPSEQSPLVTAAVSPWLSGSSFIYPISCIRVTGRLDCSILFQRVPHAWMYIVLNWETLKASDVWVTSPWILV